MPFLALCSRQIRSLCLGDIISGGVSTVTLCIWTLTSSSQTSGSFSLEEPSIFEVYQRRAIVKYIFLLEIIITSRRISFLFADLQCSHFHCWILLTLSIYNRKYHWYWFSWIFSHAHFSFVKRWSLLGSFSVSIGLLDTSVLSPHTQNFTCVIHGALWLEIPKIWQNSGKI